jgi:hypothetical protein
LFIKDIQFWPFSHHKNDYNWMIIAANFCTGIIACKILAVLAGKTANRLASMGGVGAYHQFINTFFQ